MHTYTQPHRHTDRHTHRHTNRHTYIQTDRQTDRPTSSATACLADSSETSSYSRQLWIPSPQNIANACREIRFYIVSKWCCVCCCCCCCCGVLLVFFCYENITIEWKTAMFRYQGNTCIDITL